MIIRSEPPFVRQNISLTKGDFYVIEKKMYSTELIDELKLKMI